MVLGMRLGPNRPTIGIWRRAPFFSPGERDMKTVLVYANDDAGLESRLQGAFDIARAFAAHVHCVQVRPFDNHLIGVPFGGTYALQTALEDVIKAEVAHQRRMEARLRAENISWDWSRYDGAPAQVLVDRAHLADLIVLSLPDESHSGHFRREMVSAVAVHARAPVLALPLGSRSFDCFGTAMVAWNGSAQAAAALRAAVPLLRDRAVTLVSVGAEEGAFPATDALRYLSRHGIHADLKTVPRGGKTAEERLEEEAAALGAGLIVMGAFGRGRLRETLFGGATHYLVTSGRFPLLHAH
jgi:nucleotide-binding universal stress UspA family protein